MDALLSRSVLLLVLLPLLAAQEAPNLRPLTEILGNRQEVRELEQSLAGDRLYHARRCAPLMIMLGSFLDQEQGQEKLAGTFTAVGEDAIHVVDRLEAARTEEAGRPSLEDIRVVAESVGYQYVERLMQNKKTHGHFYEGDPWLEADVEFCSERIPVLRGETGDNGSARALPGD